MSLINRVAITNFMNINGAGGHLPWEPRFRYEVLNFFGQSTALNAPNGCGKTSIVKAILALLSRDKILVRDTHQRMSPRSYGIPSHIQVEFVSPDDRYSSQSDIFIDQGAGVTGEKWVFGISGFRLGDKNDELDYYFYPGTLEDCPTGIKYDGENVTLLTPDDFDASRKILNKFWWRPKQDEWLKFMGSHVSLKAMKKLAGFQKQGSADKGVDLFKFKIPPGERLDEAFFYEIIAPEILAGAMDTFGEEDEDEIEEVIYNTVAQTINAKKKVEQKRSELDLLKQSLVIMKTVAMHAEQSKTDMAVYQEKLSTIAGTASLLENLAITHPFLGIPSRNVPDGITGEVAKHIIVEAGETDIYILASGLEVVLGEEPKHIRQRADRKQIIGRKIPESVENTCDLLSGEVTEVGQKPISYTLKQARQIIDISPKLIDGLDKKTASKVLEDSFTWYSAQGDRNPYRSELAELQRHQGNIQKDISSIEEEIESIREQEEQLYQSQQQMSANEGSYYKMRRSGLFTPTEMQEPAATAKSIKLSLTTSQRLLTDFNNKRSLLSAWKDDWKSFKHDFDTDTSPHEIERIKQEEKSAHKENILQIKQSLSQIKSNLSAAQDYLKKVEIERVKVDSKLEQFNEKTPSMSHFSILFGDIDSENLEDDLLDTKRKHESKIKELNNEIVRLNDSVNKVDQFREKFGADAEPSVQLQALNQERNTLMATKQKSDEDLSSFERKRKELDKEQIAAGDAADQARKLFKEHELEYSPLYKVIESFGLNVDRKKAVLISLSSLLFSPVFKDRQIGEQAAIFLASENIPVPVIDHNELISFCNNEDMYLDGCNSIFIGVMTMAIKCLLDPEFIEREKQDLDQLILGLGLKISDISTRILEIDPESSLLALVRAADKAINQNAEDALKESTVSLKNTQQQVEEMAPKVTNQARGWIRDAKAIKSMGGMQKYDQLQSQLKSLQESFEHKSGTVNRLNTDVMNSGALLEESNEIGNSILPSDLHSILRSAKQYYDNDGPNFEKHEDQEILRLKDGHAHAAGRYDFHTHLTASQEYLDAERQGKELSIQDRISDLVLQRGEASLELTKLKAELGTNEVTLPAVKEMIGTVDKLAINIISRYRKVAVFTKDIESRSSALPEHYREILLESENACRMARGDRDSTRQSIIRISDEIRVIDVDESLRDLRCKQRNLINTEKSLIESISRATDEPGLAVAEKEILSSVKGAKDADAAVSMWTRLRNVYETEESDLTLKELRERESRETVSGRLNYFIQRGSSSLTLFKQLASKNYGDMKANFIVDANVISEEDSEKLVLDIIATFEEAENARKSLQDKHVIVQNIESHKKSLEENIRMMIYRRVFTNPSIYFEMEAIRKKGKHLMDDSLSVGEKSAMSLMWAIRIADFAVEKDARNKQGSSRRSKARSLSENILILDGLFSDLSATDLIKGSMAGLERTRGKFQLIGLIHDEHYDNDFSIFPNLMLGKVNQSLGDAGGWVSFDNKNKDDTSVGFAQLYIATTS